MNENKLEIENPTESDIVKDIKELINQSRYQLAITVNTAMSMLYWEIGRRVNEELLKNQRAEYGKEVVTTISKELKIEYGQSFSDKNLRRMMQFAKIFSDHTNVVSVIRHLSWTHILAIIPIEDPLKREFYIEMCKIERWSVRTFRERINSMLYERTAVSKKPEITIKNEIDLLKNEKQLSEDMVFRDPYFLDFLGLNETYSEKDLESAILIELQKFIAELGSDFAFMARQKRITIDHDDYYIGLLFFHRRLKCMVAIDLKLGKFEASHKGQMELYLRWLEKYEMVDGENKPLGLIMCEYKNEEHIELLQLDGSNIKVTEYLTKLPDIKVLEAKLHLAISLARNKLDKDV